MSPKELAEERRAPIKAENRKKGGAYSIGDEDAATLESLARATPEPETPEKPDAAPAPEGQADAPAPEESVEEPAKAEGQPEPPEASAESDEQPKSRPEESTDEEPVTITKAELEALRRGNLMQADYTKKTQAVSAKDKELEADRTRLRETLAKSASYLQELETTLTSAVPKEPDWAQERARRTPEEYAHLRDEWDVFSKNLKIVQDERKRVADAQAEDFRKQWEQRTQTEREKVLAAKPELLDTERYNAWAQRIVKTAKSLGFTDEEIAGPIQADSRIALMLDQLAQTTDTRTPKTTKPPVPKSVPPAGTQGTPRPKAAIDQARERLARTAKKGTRGESLEAAGAYFDQLLSSGKGV